MSFHVKISVDCSLILAILCFSPCIINYIIMMVGIIVGSSPWCPTEGCMESFGSVRSSPWCPTERYKAWGVSEVAFGVLLYGTKLVECQN